jgi:hypothetical protein
MPVLKTLIDSPTKARFRDLAKARGLSESELLRATIEIVTSEKKDTGQPIAPDAKKAELVRATVRLPRFLMEAAEVRAKTKGMALSRWIAALAQSNLLRQPVMTNDELAALLASNRELAAIGRNINQIARALNEAFHETERVKLEKLAELSGAIARSRATVRLLVRASQHSWEIEDGAD